MRLFRSARVALAGVLLAAPAIAVAQGRTLDWPAFDVRATLDSSGALHVAERQTVRLTGEWNGVERRFDLYAGQSFDFHRLRRIDPATGDTVELVEGDLDVVDGYGWEGSTLRWRSRLPDDPPFDATELVYLLEYSFRNILVPTGGTYRLEHQFGFRDRLGDISSFTLQLSLDSIWGRPADWQGEWSVERLPPGESFLVTAPLTFLGAGTPSAVWHGTSAAPRYLIAGGFLLSLLIVIVRFVQVERTAQRFLPLVPNDAITPDWLDEHVFSLLPEVAGAAWDDKVGSPEVAATLARMVGEGKLASRVETKGWKIFRTHVLHLTRLVPERELEEYERALVVKLFPGGKETTDTESIRKTYARSGFDPTIIVRGPLQRAVDRIPDAGFEAKPLKLWPLPLALAACGLAMVIGGALIHGVDAPFALIAMLFSLPVYAFALLQARLWRRRVQRPGRHTLRFLLPLAGIAGPLLWLMVTGWGRLGALTLVGLALVALAFVVAVLNAARSRYTPERMRFRKRLASAREHFARELRQPTPQLQDAWYPYLLAFGLGPQVDKWFRAFGAAATAGSGGFASSGSVATSTSMGSSGGSNWSGFSGGGGFAGGGATVAFGAAVGGMSAAVSAASSSSGSGGGGSSSSGGSSGGGGGGGW